MNSFGLIPFILCGVLPASSMSLTCPNNRDERSVEFSSDKNEWKDSNEFFGDEGLLECVCAQHEIDHLNGILVTDSKRRYTETVIRGKKYGRNERVMVKLSDGTTEFMKYKKAESLLSQGAEIL